MFRFWMARDTYQAVSAVQSTIFLNIAQYYFNTAALAYTFFMCSAPEFWTPALSSMDVVRINTLDLTIGGRAYGVFGHDWRVTPIPAWLELLAEREIAAEPLEHRPAPATTTVLVQSREAFDASVRAALQQFTNASALRANLLTRSRMVLERSGAQAAETERVAELQRMLRLAVEQLEATYRELKSFPALYHTCIQPAETQERAAELLDVPFSSYRRHLRSGIVQAAEIMWHWELSGTPSATEPSSHE